MGYEDIKSGITKVLQDTKEKTIKVTEEIVSCENDHPIVYINVPLGKIITPGRGKIGNVSGNSL